MYQEDETGVSPPSNSLYALDTKYSPSVVMSDRGSQPSTALFSQPLCSEALGNITFITMLVVLVFADCSKWLLWWEDSGINHQMAFISLSTAKVAINSHFHQCDVDFSSKKVFCQNGCSIGWNTQIEMQFRAWTSQLHLPCFQRKISDGIVVGWPKCVLVHIGCYLQ